MTSFCGEHRGFIKPPTTTLICPTFSQLAKHSVPMKMISHSVGVINEPEPKFCSPRSSYQSFALQACQGFLENNIEEFQLYKAHSDSYICSLIPGSPNFQAQYTPGGLFYKGSESNLQYVTTSSFLLLKYAKYLRSHGGAISCGTSTITSDKLVGLAKKQVDYILGDNPAKMSYMVGWVRENVSSTRAPQGLVFAIHTCPPDSH